MLRNDVEVALNDLAVACQEAADAHEAAADSLDDQPRLQGACQELARTRASQAHEIREEVRRLGDYPRTPDRDLESLRGILTRMKAVLGAGGPRLVVRDQEEAERLLAEAARRALEEDLPDPARQLAAHLAEDAEDARRRLAELDRESGAAAP